MFWSPIAAMLTVLLAGLAPHLLLAEKEPAPLFESTGNTIAAAIGVPVFGVVVPDSQFSPLPDHAPVWVKAGVEIAFLGRAQKRNPILGVRGPLSRLPHPIAA